MSELPKGWANCKLESCVEILDSQRKPINTRERQTRIEGKDTDELYPYYGATGKVGYIDNFLFDGEFVALGEDGVPFFDLLKRKAYMLEGKSWVNNHAHVIKGASGVSNKYLCYYLNQVDYHGFVNGATRLKLTQANMRKLPIRLAPLNEQIRIANKLDSILAKVDVAQARLDKIPNILKCFRQSVLAAATSGELTKEWREKRKLNLRDWTKSTLSEVATTLDPNPSHRYPKADVSGVPILSTQQFVGESGWTTDKAKLVNRDFFEERKSKTGFYHDDIIFARKGRLGLARYAPKKLEYVLSHTVFIIRPGDIVDNDFILLFLKDNNVMEWLIKEMNSNTGVPTLGKGVFEKAPIAVPTIEEQKEIVRLVESLFTMADTVEKQYKDAKSRTNRLTQSILAKAFRGELVPQDTNDEPASELLARIKAEQISVKKPKLIKKANTKKAANA